LAEHLCKQGSVLRRLQTGTLYVVTGAEGGYRELRELARWHGPPLASGVKATRRNIGTLAKSYVEVGVPVPEVGSVWIGTTGNRYEVLPADRWLKDSYIRDRHRNKTRCVPLQRFAVYRKLADAPFKPTPVEELRAVGHAPLTAEVPQMRDVWIRVSDGQLFRVNGRQSTGSDRAGMRLSGVTLIGSKEKLRLSLYELQRDYRLHHRQDARRISGGASQPPGEERVRFFLARKRLEDGVKGVDGYRRALKEALGLTHRDFLERCAWAKHDPLEQGVEITCTLEQFARLMILRKDYGAANWFSDLQTRIVRVEPAKEDPYQVLASITGADRETVRKVVLAAGYSKGLFAQLRAGQFSTDEEREAA
jgi:hypothetical protein